MNDGLENNAINPSVNNKKNQTFNLIIGIATLLIAIFGVTFAYFTATARSDEGEVMVKSAMVSINFEHGTEIGAENLIPSTEAIMLKMYKDKAQEAYVVPDGVDTSAPDYTPSYIEDYDKYVAANGESDLSNYLDRKCIDAKGKEVCSVFRFSLLSEGDENGSSDIMAYITVNKNEFQNLAYLVYEVEYELDENKEIIYDKYGFGIVKSYNLVSANWENLEEQPPFSFFKSPDNIYEGQELVKVVYPVACLWGEYDDVSSLADDDIARCKPLTVTNQVEHYYQVVIWLNETGSEQLEQGLTFNGTASVSVSGDATSSGYANGRITGTDTNG